MKPLLSRIDDVFDIKGAGIIIVPGHFRSSRICISVGDPLEVKRPDGTLLITHVRDIPMFHVPPECDLLSLMPGENLTKTDLPIGSELWIDAKIDRRIQFHLPSITLTDLTSKLFESDDAGHIRFGSSATSIHTASINDLIAGALEFQDEMMAGILSYLLSIAITDDRVILSVGLLGLKHDQFARTQVELLLNETGIKYTTSLS